MKKFFSVAALLAAVVLGAAEVVFDGGKAAVWSSRRITDGADGVLTATVGYVSVLSKEFIPVEKGKTYVISGEFRLIPPPEKCRIYFGFVPYTADGKAISYLSVTSASPALATLAKEIKAGDKSVTLSGADKWKINVYGRLVFNAKEDLSDLPNFDSSPALLGKEAKVNADGTLEIPVAKPFTKAYPAGTVVRQHKAGNAYIYAGTGNKAGQWMTFSHSYSSFYTGTAKIKLAFNLDVAKCQVEIRNIKVTVE